MSADQTARPLTRFGPSFGATTDLPTVALPDGSEPAALPPVPPAGPPDVDDSAGGVHAITKKTDYWFEREVGGIERRAEESANDWAIRGLPRHDLPRTEPLEPEQVLAKLCGQIFRDWQLRVRTKVQDAIQEGCRELNETVGTLRGGIARIEAVGAELHEREAKIERIKRESRDDTRPVRYDRIIPRSLFWGAAIALGLVEFVANFPVFRLLLPMNTALARVAETLARNVQEDDVLAGVKLFRLELLTHVEAAIVAAVAVVILVVLGKQFGQSTRPLAALRAADYPMSAPSIRSHQRQHGAIAAAGLLGIACVLSFLFAARRDIADVAQARVAADSVEFGRADAAYAAAQAADSAGTLADPMQITKTEKERTARERTLRAHRDEAAYASTVQRNNLPIALLNLGLVLTAAVLGFGYAHADLTERRGEHPDLAPLRERCLALRNERTALAASARAASGRAYGAVGAVQHLLRAHPLRGWESKVARLESVIPRFRGANARLRGLDPANIRAFDLPPVLDLPPLDEQTAFAEPAGFARLQAELGELSEALERVLQQSAQGVSPAPAVA